MKRKFDMDRESLNEDNIEKVEEIEDIKELTQEEAEETLGGEAGYGNIQFKCKTCKYECLNARKLAIHFSQTRHNTAYVYHQKKRGKNSKGGYVGDGWVHGQLEPRDVHGNTSVYLKYPNNRIYVWKVDAYGNAVCRGYRIRLHRYGTVILIANYF